MGEGCLSKPYVKPSAKAMSSDKSSSPRDKSSSPRGHDVIIVGGGIAGLACAVKLNAEGFDVIVLEGRDRVGGRMLSSPEGVDLGPAWIWPGDTRVLSLLKEVKLQTVPQSGDRNLPCGPDAVRVKGGYALLPEALAARLPEGCLQLGQSVSAIKSRSGQVEVHSQSGEEYIAQRVVVAAPPSVVTSSISFTPELPKDQARFMAETPTWAGDWAKVAVTFKRPVWKEAGLAYIAEGRPVSVWWEAGGGEDGEAFALGGFAFGRDAAQLAKSSAKKHIVAQLVSMFGAAVQQELLEVHHKGWGEDSFTCSDSTINARGDPRRMYGSPLLRRPTGWGVHFAGTEAEVESGHVEGALLSAARACKEVVAGCNSAKR